MKILISGAGIAGPTLAYWLDQHGFEPTIVEAAPQLRAGGYLVDFWGAGFEIADRMGIADEITNKSYNVREVRVVNQLGKRVAGFAVDAFLNITHGRFVTLPRNELAKAIFDKIQGRVETIFGDSIASIEQTDEEVRVAFQNGGARKFDLVVGADGLHSRVRELVFGEESKFEKYLGYKVAVFEAQGYRPRDERVNVMYTQVNRQLARFALRDDRTMFVFTFKDDNPGGAKTVQTQKALLRKHFGNGGWECPQILDALDATSDLYFDRVSQIRMESRPGLWTQGRVTLAGDAASCVTLLAGQGTALAMMAGYILAGELHRANGDYAKAFQRYQQLFGPFVLKKQKAAPRVAGTFAPSSKLAIFLRNEIFQLLSVRWIADLAVGHTLADKLALPNYS